jgi:hypothetical protein
MTPGEEMAGSISVGLRSGVRQEAQTSHTAADPALLSSTSRE